MAPLRIASALVLWALASRALAQEQAILSSGTGDLPACAQTCSNLIRASAACDGTTSASQTAWICFCQSAYLQPLRQSAVGVCSDTCTAQADLTQVSSWYNTNCGSDNGASEHTGAAAAASSTVAGGAASSSAVATATTATAGAGLSTTSSTPGTSSAPTGDWWSNHYKWIIMLIVLAIAIPAIALLGRWFKRRHDRRQDQVRNGFNTGITSHSGPISRPDQNHSGVLEPPGVNGSGRASSPARTRDAFMPYGYGYSRSESRLGTGQAGRDERRSSPLAAGEDASDLEEKGVAVSSPEPTKRKSRRVLVRERSTNDSAEAEKRSRFD